MARTAISCQQSSEIQSPLPPCAPAPFARQVSSSKVPDDAVLPMNKRGLADLNPTSRRSREAHSSGCAAARELESSAHPGWLHALRTIYVPCARAPATPKTRRAGVLKAVLCVGLGTFALAAGTPAHAQWPHPGWRRALVVYGGQHLEASPRQVGRCVIKQRTVVARGRTLMRRGRC